MTIKNLKPDLFNEREIRIIKLICKEYTSGDIADAIGINKRTVEGYRREILKKTKSRSSIGIFKFAVKYGLHKL